MVSIDYSFNIKPHGIPRLMKYLKLQELERVSNGHSKSVNGTVSLTDLDLRTYVVGGLRLHRYNPTSWYQFYIDFGGYCLTGLADFENAEKVIKHLRIIPEKNRLDGSDKIYVGMGGIYF